MVMTSLRDTASGGIGKFILFGFLVLAAGGLVFSDVGGFFRDGVSGSDVAKVGDTTISIQQFDNTLRRTINRLNITPEQAYQLGYTQQILNSEIRGELMASAARENDIRVGKKHIAQEIKKIVMPMAQDGQSPEDVLSQLLVAQNMSERQLVATIRKDVSVNLLNTGLQNGFVNVSTAMTKDLAAFENETRAIQYVLFTDKDVEMSVPPKDEELQQLYAATKEAYAISETRQAQLVMINTKDLEATLDITEDEVRVEYEDNIDAYKFAESRSVAQTILRTEEDAQKVFDKVQGGASLKDAVKAVMGNTTDYIPPQPVTKDNILAELSEAVFAAEKGDAVGPVKSALGHHVLVLSDLKAAYTQSFDDAKADIRKELTATRLIDTKFELANTVDDMLASGATPEDLKGEVDVEIKTLPAVDLRGNAAGDKDAFAGMEADKAAILESMFELGEGESSAVFETSDNVMATVFVQTITPKSYRPFEAIKPTLAARWDADQRRAANRAAMQVRFASMMGDDGASLKDVASKASKQIKKLGKISRRDEPKAPLNPRAVGAIFATPVGEPVILELADGAAIAVVTANKLHDKTKDKEVLAELKTALVKGAKTEGLSVFLDKKNAKIKATINDRLLKQVYGGEAQDNGQY